MQNVMKNELANSVTLLVNYVKPSRCKSGLLRPPCGPLVIVENCWFSSPTLYMKKHLFLCVVPSIEDFFFCDSPAGHDHVKHKENLTLPAITIASILEHKPNNLAT